MVRQMLAADELAPTDYENGVATGYIVRNWWALNPNEWMRNNVEHTGKAFLGLTFNCAHCHDHKYDPISNDDYFGFRAFFEPIGIRQDRVLGQPDPGPYIEYEYLVQRKIQRLGSVRIYDRNAEAPTWFYTGGDERNRVESRGTMPPKVPAVLAGAGLDIRPVDLPPTAYYPGLRPEIQEFEERTAAEAVKSAEAARAALQPPSEEELAPLRQQVAAAQSALDAALATSGDGALSGRQSLVLDATGGRRILNNPLAGIFPLEDGAELRLVLMIVRDAHFNFQLARDTQAGLTSGYVAFENGTILSYQPGTFNVFQAGAYSVAAGQTRLEMRLRIDRSSDRCLLTVRSLSDGQVLVKEAPVALNGWNPVSNPANAITLDARPGVIVALDDIVVCSASASTDGTGVLTFDFESPHFADGQDVVGIQGWMASALATAGATSRVSRSIGSDKAAAERQALALAQDAQLAKEFSIQVADLAIASSRALQASVHARIAADRARYGITPGGDVESLKRAASLAERTAVVAVAEANRQAARLAKVQAEQLPGDSAERGAKIEAAQKQLSDSEQALAAARADLEDPAKDQTYTPLSPVFPRQSTGRRKALAEWITSRENPLTPRVAVNHIWLRHFHGPLVATVNDFGRSGASPTHPGLLDWLAAEFVESGWSMKHLHRLIVMSATYKQMSKLDSSAEAEPALAVNRQSDPDNRLLWHMNVGRMEAEVVRDSLLANSGRLDDTVGGQELENSDALTTFRRSLYYSCQPEADGMSEFGRLFDAPNANECYRRTRTIVPQQALVLTNSDFMHGQCADVAARIQAGVAGAADPSAAFVDYAFQSILSRSPSVAETAACRGFLDRQSAQFLQDGVSDSAAEARESLVRALFNHNDFLAIQ